MSRYQHPRIFTSFKGVVLEPGPWWSPQPRQTGLAEFLEGAQETGAETAGIISARRPKRRTSVVKAIGEQGLDRFFDSPQHDRNQVRLVGSQLEKARNLAIEAGSGPVGMLDRHPEEWGPLLMRALMAQTYRRQHDANPSYRTPISRYIGLGVLGATVESDDRLNQLVETTISTVPGYIHPAIPDDGIGIEIWAPDHGVKIRATPIPELTRDAGLAFGSALISHASADGF